MALHRNDHQTSGNEPMDRLCYNYYNNTNQLSNLDETVAPGRYTNDIDDQAAGNYNYDEIGNLIQDNAEVIDEIQWYVHPCGRTAVQFLPEAGFHGVNVKIRAINLSISPTQSQPNLVFAYGPDGQRIRKDVTWRTGGDTIWYVRDAQGNTMAVYLERNDCIFAKEHYMYGSSPSVARLYLKSACFFGKNCPYLSKTNAPLAPSCSAMPTGLQPFPLTCFRL